MTIVNLIFPAGVNGRSPLRKIRLDGVPPFFYLIKVAAGTGSCGMLGGLVEILKAERVEFSEMKGSQDETLKTRIKRLIVDNCDLDIELTDIDDDAPLFERASNLELDSIDALQISIAVQNNFGIAIRDSKEMRRVMKSINSFADHIQPA